MIDENQSIMKCFEISIKYNKMEQRTETERGSMFQQTINPFRLNEVMFTIKWM